MRENKQIMNTLKTEYSEPQDNNVTPILRRMMETAINNIDKHLCKIQCNYDKI